MRLTFNGWTGAGCARSGWWRRPAGWAGRSWTRWASRSRRRRRFCVTGSIARRRRTRCVPYAHDLKLFFGFLAERSLGWRELSPAELGEFVAWLRRPAGNVLLLPGTPPARAASTVNRALSAVMSFYDFHRLQGVELADLIFD